MILAVIVEMFTKATVFWLGRSVLDPGLYQLITGTPVCSFQWNLNRGCMSHPDAGHRVKAILGEDQQLHV